MKFRATFSDKGVRVLEKAFLPTLEKFGKTCQVLLGPTEVFLVQTTLDTDGPHVTEQLAVAELFDESSYTVHSRNYNLIGFSVDVGLFLKVLKSAGANDADSLEIRLTQKQIAQFGDSQAASKPFLSFIGKAQSLQLVQDLPISKPFTKEELDVLVSQKEVPRYCDYYVNLLSAGPRLPSVVDRMKSIAGVARFAVCKNGDLHLQVTATNVMLGTQFQGLHVMPAGTECDPNVVKRDQTGEEQLQAALDAGEAQVVHLQLKHLSRVLSARQCSEPSEILCGISQGGGHVHVVYVFRDPGQDALFDASLGISFKLPVREDA
eukprot:jgi/Chrzof1/10705/Cz05g09140.t1